MIYSTKNDFYLKFKPIYNNEGNFIDYELKYVSEDFYEATNINPEGILEKKFSDIAINNSEMLNFKELYLNTVPTATFKYKTYVEELNRWYLINILTDKVGQDEFMVIFFVDVTEIVISNETQSLQGENTPNNIFYLKDIDREKSSLTYFNS